MPNKVLLKKSSVAAKVPLTTDLDYGELALNYTDGKLYFKNASNVIKSFTIDDSVVTLTGTQTLSNKTLSSPTVTGNISGDVAATGLLKSLNSINDEGGEILLAKPQTNTTIAGTGVTIDVYQNKLRFFEDGGTARGFYIDLTSGGNGAGTNLAGPGGTVTSVALTVPTGLSVSGSPITTTGTLAITLSAGYSIPTTTSQSNWDTAFTDRLKWDGGSSGLVASTGRTSLGATTLGSNLFTIANPSAVTFPRFNADNTVSSLSAADFRTATGSGTVTSVGGTGTVSGLTLSGTVTTSGNLTLSGTLSASIDNITDEHRLFNNMGDNHTTRTFFDATTPGYNFGWRYIQGNTNGPGVNSATQYYSLYVGLGNDYPATGAGSYGMQLAIPRNVTTPYLAIRYNEANALGTWQKISAGYADSAGAVDWANVSNKPDPVVTVTLTGDVTGTANATLTDLGSGTITVATTVAANSVALGTDTTGDYVSGLTAGTGISITGTAGEGWSPTVTNTAPNVTTDISITHNASTVVVVSSDGADGTINAATTLLAGVLSSADKTKLDGIAAGAEVNQNTFSNVAVSGQTTVAADAKSDTLTLVAGSNVTITTDAVADSITIASATPGDGTLSIATKTAGATNTDVTLNLSGAYSANTTTNRTINAVVGPALTALASTMTGAGTGFLRKNGADTYTVDTNTYLTAESDTLATVTGRGNSTSTNIGSTSGTALNFVTAGNVGTWIGGIQDGTSGWSLSQATIGFKSDNATYAAIGIATAGGLLYFGRTTASGVGTMSSWLEVNSGGVANFKLARPQHNGSNLALVSELPTVGAGALAVSIGTAGATNTTVTWGTSTGFNANTGTSYTYDLKVGPALTNLATLMSTAGAGFIRRGATADTYTIDTNTYLTAEADTLATVTARGATTSTSITLTNTLVTNIGGGATSSTKHIQMLNGTGYDLFMLPRAGAGSYNTLTQAGDSLIGYSAGSVDTGALVIGPWSASSKGIRIDSSGNVGVATSTINAKFVVNGGTVNTSTYTSSEARISDGTIHLMKTVAGGVFEAVRAINNDVTVGTTVRVLGAATSDPFNNANGGKVFIDAIRTATNMDLAFLLNDVSGAAAVERVRFMGGGNVGIGTSNPGYKLEVNGSFAATTKSFVINHPTKPGKKLRYGSLEGPENGVYVRGKLKGTNVIELPDYWTKLVDPETITVNLTPIGKHQNLYVEEIIDNKVIIANGNLLNKEINCYYTVFAERIDVDKLEVEIE